MKDKGVILYIVYILVFTTVYFYLFALLDEAYTSRISHRFWAIVFVVVFTLSILIKKKSKVISVLVTFLVPLLQVILLINADLHQKLVEMF